MPGNTHTHVVRWAGRNLTLQCSVWRHFWRVQWAAVTSCCWRWRWRCSRQEWGWRSAAAPSAASLERRVGEQSAHAHTLTPVTWHEDGLKGPRLWNSPPFLSRVIPRRCQQSGTAIAREDHRPLCRSHCTMLEIPRWDLQLQRHPWETEFNCFDN